MPVSADTFTISAIVLLIMGAVCFYLFTRIKQVEKKLSLMEGILLDLKTANESGFLGFPAGKPLEEDDEEEEEEDAFLPMKPDEEAEIGIGPSAADEIRKIEIDELITNADTGIPSFDEAEEEAATSEETGSVQVNKLEYASTDLDSMSMSELTSIAKNRGMTVTSKMRKAQLITALRQMEVAMPALPVPPSIQQSVAPSADLSPLDPDGMAAGSSLLGNSSLMASPI